MKKIFSAQIKGGYLFDVFAYVAVIGMGILLFQKGAEDQGYYWQWFRVPQYLYQIEEGHFIAGPILRGLWVTLKISALSLVLAYIVGLLTALMRLFEGAYASEIFRAGIVGIDKGQWEAGYSLGFSTLQNFRYIVFPQAIRNILPPLTGQAVALIKDSSLVSVIAIYEMTMVANEIVSETFLTFEIFFTVAGIYLLLTFALSRITAYLESRHKPIL